MFSKPALRSKGFQRLVVAAVFCLAGLGAFVRADGPSAIPPGGVAIIDNDGGDGQRWGRFGGRTITYTISIPSNFTAISWGVANGTNPNLSLNGSSSGMVFNGGQSNLAAGVARWTGTANGLYTRFTMSASLPLSFVGGQVNPGVDLSSTPSFTVTLLFELSNDGIGYSPALAFFDSCNCRGNGTPSPGAGPMQTDLNVAFYYTTASTTDIALDTATLNGVLGLKGDTIALKNDTTALKNGVTSMQTTLAALGVQIAALTNLTAPDLTGLQTSLTSALQQIGNANTKLDAIQNLLQDTSLSLDVLPFKEYRTDGKRAWILKTVSHGQLVDSTLTTAFIVKTPASGPSTVQDATFQMSTVPIGTGLLEVTYVGPAATIQVFQFNLQATVNSVVVTGSTLTP